MKPKPDPIDHAEALIAAYRQDFENAKEAWLKYRRPATWLTGKTDEELWDPRTPRINWDEDWDGILVCRVRALAKAGILVTHFYRKQKIMFKADNRSRSDIIQLLLQLYGESWRGLSFKPTAIWWRKTSSGRWY